MNTVEATIREYTEALATEINEYNTRHNVPMTSHRATAAATGMIDGWLNKMTKKLGDLYSFRVDSMDGGNIWLSGTVHGVRVSLQQTSGVVAGKLRWVITLFADGERISAADLKAKLEG